jgi:tetratricopeptide (TPR) repeat protein
VDVEADDWLKLADWDLRSREFGSLRDYDDGRSVVAMDFGPAEAAPGEWLRLRDSWLDISPHPHIVDALDKGEGERVILRYAAFDWNHPLIRLDANRRASEMVAEWGEQITDAFLAVRADVGDSDLGLFLRPEVRIDLGGAARLTFLPVSSADATSVGDQAASSASSNGDERTIVAAIGKALHRFCSALDSAEAAAIRSILDRCVQTDASQRYQSLDELRAVWKTIASGDDTVRAGEKLAAWSLAEEALGWLKLGRSMRALELFENALTLAPHLRFADVGRRRALEVLGVFSGDLVTKAWSENQRRSRPREPVPIEPLPTVLWSEAAELGRKLEDERAFSDALALYQRTTVDKSSEVSIYTGMARCYLALDHGQQAVECAQRVLAIDSKNLEAQSLRARGYLFSHKLEDALKCAGVWLTVSRNDPSAHYMRGRALLGLGRFEEARDAFDRACALKPDMVEAMLLRREADRAMGRVRKDVGTQPKIEIDLPEHLAGLRDALANGRVREAIAVLEGPEYESDAIAKLVQAECLAFDRRYEEALELFDRAASLSADQRLKSVVGKVHALLSLERAAEALAELDRANDLVDVGLVELRGLVLRRLGLPSDAEDELGRVVTAAGSRSDLRVGRQ